MKRLTTIAIVATCVSPIVFSLATAPGLALTVESHGTRCVPYWGDALFLGHFHVSDLGGRILNFINLLAFAVPPLFWTAVGSQECVGRFRRTDSLV
jgi:hypothetical protein